jgi:ABC-type lipoprotein export system ATPase subunit
MLNINDAIVGYGETPILHLDKLFLPQGGQCVITGASGSGKTTLLYAIAGLVKLFSGSITIQGTNIHTLSEAGRDQFRGQHIGIIFQTLHLVRSLSVLDNLLLASYATGIPQKKDEAEALLNKLGLSAKKNTLPGTLSQGQAQRAAIARAVLNRPSLILADEPTSSLDDHNCTEVIKLLKEVAGGTNATLLISTHDARVKPHFSQVIHLENEA